jgi:hypothetical protein
MRPNISFSKVEFWKFWKFDIAMKRLVRIYKKNHKRSVFSYRGSTNGHALV